MNQPDHYVLVLDDNIHMCNLAQEVWKRYNVELVNTQSLEDAIELLKARKFSLIAVSHDFLQEETTEVIKVLRRLSIEPIIVISGEDNSRNRVVFLERGADAFMPVPSTLEEGVATGWALIRRYTELNQQLDVKNVLYRGKLLLHLDSRRVFVDEKEVILTRLEFDILKFLMEGNGRVYSYEDVFRAIWGEPYVGMDKTVLWSHIRKIRKKLSVDPDVARYIRNVHSVGYKFVVK